MSDQFEIHWLDHGREPQCDPDPNYPDGVDIKVESHILQPSCKTDLPYPAKRCGIYVVHCTKCGLRVAVTTAGRPDDPRSVEINCLPTVGAAGTA